MTPCECVTMLLRPQRTRISVPAPLPGRHGEEAAMDLAWNTMEMSTGTKVSSAGGA